MISPKYWSRVGRVQRTGKATTDCYLQMDSRQWQRKGWFRPGLCFVSEWSQDGKVIASVNVRTEPGRIALTYHNRGNDGLWQKMEYPVSITWTPCHYGGARAWFICPAQGCGRRVAILYVGRVFVCRDCYQLAYGSQRNKPIQRAIAKAQKIRRRLGGDERLFAPFPGKPKGMHWSTYERLRRQEEAASATLEPTWAKLVGCRADSRPSDSLWIR